MGEIMADDEVLPPTGKAEKWRIPIRQTEENLEWVQEEIAGPSQDLSEKHKALEKALTYLLLEKTQVSQRTTNQFVKNEKHSWKKF